MAPQEGVAGRVKPAFWNFLELYCAEMERDELRQDWHRFEEREMKEKHVGEVLKKILKIVSLYKQSFPSVAPAVSISSSHLSPADHHILIFHHLHLP